jgi:hypothetical protein
MDLSRSLDMSKNISFIIGNSRSNLQIKLDLFSAGNLKYCSPLSVSLYLFRSSLSTKPKISEKRINEYRSLADKRHRSMLERRLERDLQISYITDIGMISKRFVDKLLSVLSKYDQDEDRRLIIICIDLMVSKARREQGYRSIEH